MTRDNSDGFGIDRRTVLAAGATTLAFGGLIGASLVEARSRASNVVDYEITWHGGSIGTQHIEIEEKGEETRVVHKGEINVSVLFMNALSMTHYSEEVWRGGQLVDLSSNTVNNGVASNIAGTLQDDVFIVEGLLEKEHVPKDVATVDSFWLRSAIGHKYLLDTRNGHVLSWHKEALGVRKVEHHGVEYHAEGFRITTEESSAVLWYRDGLLLVSDVTAMGATAHAERKKL